jgi:hypothetical protein
MGFVIRFIRAWLQSLPYCSSECDRDGYEACYRRGGCDCHH